MNFITPLRVVLWILCGILAVGAYILRYVLWGYSFSALVCCCLIALILFYTLVPLLAVPFPMVYKWLTRIVTVCLIVGILIVGITEALVIKASFGTPHDSVDYLLVLGAKVRVTGPSASLWDRIYGAEAYLKSHPNTIAIVSGGQGDDEPWPEAGAMYSELVNLGIEPERIWIEDKATSTWENINFALDLIEEKTGSRPDTLGILSSEYHLFRASLFAKECGIGFVGVPARTSRMGQTINHFMREVAGVWHFLLLGGQYD